MSAEEITMIDVKNEVLSIDRSTFNQGQNAKYDISVSGGGIAHTIVARGPGAVCYKEPLGHCVTMTTSSHNNNKLTKENM